MSSKVEFNREQTRFIDTLLENVKSFCKESSFEVEHISICDEFHVSLSKPLAIKNSICQNVISTIQECFKSQKMQLLKL